MKKIIKLLTVGLFAVAALAGCGSNDSSSKHSTSSEPSKPSSSTSTPTISSTTPSTPEVIDGPQKLRLHYYRVDEDYEGWSTWLWPSGCNGGRYYFSSKRMFDIFCKRTD